MSLWFEYRSKRLLHFFAKGVFYFRKKANKKVRTTEVTRTEKRKPHLLSHKIQPKIESLFNQLTEFAFLPILLWLKQTQTKHPPPRSGDNPSLAYFILCDMKSIPYFVLTVKIFPQKRANIFSTNRAMLRRYGRVGLSTRRFGVDWLVGDS